MATIRQAHYPKPHVGRGKVPRLKHRKVSRRKRAAFSKRLSGFPGADITARAWRGTMHRHFEYFRDLGRK